MNQRLFRRNSSVVLVCAVLLGLVWMGCASTVQEREGEAVIGEGREISRSGARYYYFEDVLIPGELKYQQKKSSIYETPKFKMGWMVFSKFRIDVDSVMDFFTYYMEKDNWKLVNSFKGKESILNFSKPDKTCTIRISENWYGKAEVEVRIGPLGEKKF